MPPHGLVYPQNFLSSLPVLLPRPAPHAPIRALTAAQFAKIRHLHLTADIPDSVLFPFLHGIEGDNHAQNLFFSSKHGRNVHQKVDLPDYRGLIWVVCDDDDMLLVDRQDDEHDLDELDLDDDEDQLAGDLASHAEADAVQIPSPHDRRPSDASSLSSSESIFSQSMSSSALSVSTAATSIHSSNPSASSSSLSSPCTASPRPRTTSHLLTSTFRPCDLLTSTHKGPAFIPPHVPKGNLNIPFSTYSDSPMSQASRYATSVSKSPYMLLYQILSSIRPRASPVLRLRSQNDSNSLLRQKHTTAA